MGPGYLWNYTAPIKGFDFFLKKREEFLIGMWGPRARGRIFFAYKKKKESFLEILGRRKSQHVWGPRNTVHASTPQLPSSLSFIKRGGRFFVRLARGNKTRLGLFFFFMGSE